MLFSNSAHQISRTKSVPWHSKNKSAFLKTWFGSGKWLFYFFKAAFFQPIWMLCVSCIRAVYFTEILLLVTPVSCAGSAEMGESAWLGFGLCITGRIVTSPWCLKSLAMMQEPGKSTTWLSHPRLSLQCCQLKKIWTLLFFFFFLPPENPIKIWNLKKIYLETF